MPVLWLVPMITRPEDEEVGLARLLPCRCASVPPPPPPPPPLLPPLPLPLSPSFPCWRAQPRVVHVVLRAAQPAMVSTANAEQQSARLLQAHGPPCMARRRWRASGAWGRGGEVSQNTKLARQENAETRSKRLLLTESALLA